MTTNIPTEEVVDLGPFRAMVMTIGTLPTAFTESMTYYEALAYFVSYLEKTIIPAINQNAEATKELQKLFVELKDYVDHYFENLDVQQEINNKLDDMVEDGTLAEIINQEIFGELNERVETLETNVNITSQSYLDMQRKCRWFYRNGNDPDFDSSTDYAYLQGGVYVGNDKFVIVRIKHNNACKLEEISALDGSVIRSLTIDVGHGNSVAFNPTTNKIYVASLIDGSNNPTPYVYEFNYSTFELLRTISVSGISDNEGVHSVSYDYITGKYYIGTETQPTNNFTLYELNITTGEATLIDLPDPTGYLGKTNNNDMIVYDGIAYIMKQQPQMILAYKISNLEFIKVYNIRDYNGFGYNVGELQNLSIAYDKTDKDVYILTNKIECKNGFYQMAQFFSANFTKCVVEGDQQSAGIDHILYVDINSNATNPDGRGSNKFKHISEAIDVAVARKNISYISVANGTYPYLYVAQGCGVLAIVGESEANVIINGVSAYNQSRLYLTALTVNNTLSTQNYDLYLDTGNYRLSNVTCANSGVSQHIYVHNVYIEFFNITGESFYCQAENTFNCYDNEPDYIFVHSRPTMLQPVKIATFNTIDSTTTTPSANIVTDMLNNTTMLLKLHGYYSYFNAYLNSLNYTGNRVTSTTAYSKIFEINVFVNTTTSKLSLAINRCLDLRDGSVSNITDSASLDGSVWVQ